MIKINNDKEYREFLLHMSLWLLTGCVLMLFLKPSFWVGTVILTVIIGLIFLSQSFTESVSVDDTNVTIVYYRFFSKKEIVINKSNMKSKLSKTGSFRGPVYWVLDIMKQNKKVYSIDSRDGFSEDDLIMIDNSLKPLC